MCLLPGGARVGEGGRVEDSPHCGDQLAVEVREVIGRPAKWTSGVSGPTDAVCHASGVDHFNFVISLDRDFLDFIAAMTGHLLSWPVAFVVVVAVFYRQLKRLIGRIKSGKFPGFEFNTVEEELEEAAEEATEAVMGATSKRNSPPAQVERKDPVSNEPQSSPATGGENPAGPQAVPSNLDQMVQQGDRSAFDRRLRELQQGIVRSWNDSVRSTGAPIEVMLASWQRLEKKVEKLHVKAAPSDAFGRMPVTEQVHNLLVMGLVDESFWSSFRRLQRIRNQVVHGHVEFTASEAQAFQKTATQLGIVLDSVGHPAED